MLPNTYFTDFRDKLRLNDDRIHKIKKEVEADSMEFATQVKAIFEGYYPLDKIRIGIHNYDYFTVLFEGKESYDSDFNCYVMDNIQLDFEVVTIENHPINDTQISFYYEGFPKVK